MGKSRAPLFPSGKGRVLLKTGALAHAPYQVIHAVRVGCYLHMRVYYGNQPYSLLDPDSSDILQHVIDDSYGNSRSPSPGQPPHYRQHATSQQSSPRIHEGEGLDYEGQDSQATTESVDVESLAVSWNPHLVEPQRWLRIDMLERRTPVALRVPYPYIDDLLALEAYRRQVVVSPQLQAIITPLKWRVWEAVLSTHPNPEFGNCISQGIREGFRIGFDGQVACRATSAKLPSATEHPQPVEEFLSGECEARRVIGPLSVSALSFLHISRFGVIPKSTPGKWRLILDLPSPCGASVNDGISPEVCHLQLASVDDAVQLILKLGPGTQQAYRNVPVHPQGRWLLGMQWQGQYYVDKVLPFGLRFAPKIFCAISDGLEWALHQRGVRYLAKYIDDFLVTGPPDSPICQDSVTETHVLCEELGLPLAIDKAEGPANVISFLGIVLDSEAMQIRLLHVKLLRLQADLERWSDRKACRKRDLLSLIVRLAHACKVVLAGRSFLRRMIDLSTKVQSLDHWIRPGADERRRREGACNSGAVQIQITYVFPFW